MNKNSHFNFPFLKGIIAGMVCLSPLLSSNWENILAEVYGTETIARAGNTGDFVEVTISVTDGQFGVSDGPNEYRYLWILPDESELTGKSITSEFESPGEYPIQLQIVDTVGNSHQKDYIVAITDTPLPEVPEPQRPNLVSTAEAILDVCPALGTVQDRTEGEEQLFSVCSAVILESTDEQRLVAIDEISGDQISGQQTNSIDIAGLQLRNIAGRLRAVREGARGVSVAGLGFNVNGRQVPAAALQDMLENMMGAAAGEAGLNSRWGVFLNGNISFGEKDDSLRETGFEFDTFGITAGFDYRFSNNLFAGIAFGYGASDSDFARDGGGLESDGFNLSGYTSYYRGNAYVDAIASIGRSDHDSDRNINIEYLGINETTSGSTEGDQLSLGIETGLNFDNSGWTITPNISAFYSDVDIDAFSERGSVNGLDLAYGQQAIDSLTLGAGLAAAYSYSTAWGVLRPSFRADFIRELEDDPQVINVRFVNDPFADDPSGAVAPITITTDAPDRDYFLIGIGVSAQFQGGVSSFIDWQTLQGYEDLEVDTVRFGLRWEVPL